MSSGLAQEVEQIADGAQREHGDEEPEQRRAYAHLSTITQPRGDRRGITVSALAQILGLVLASIGAWLLWSPWALVIGGVLLLIGPELPKFRRAS